MPMNNKNLIAGSAVVIFIIAIVAAGRYVALTPSVKIDSAAPASTEAAQPDQQNPMTAMPAPAGGKVDSVDVMVERLRARLASEPNDVNGWVLLARSYHYLERWDDAKAAFAKARALGYQGDTDMGADSAPKQSATMNESANVHGSASGDTVFNDIGRVGSARADAAPAPIQVETNP